MGLSDREYYRDEPSGFNLGGDWSAMATLIVINAVVFLVGMFTPIVNPFNGSNWVQENLALEGDLFKHPWDAWQLLTYGFVHGDIWHIVFNMLGLFVFGRDIEAVYGRKEFYKLYLSLIVMAGLVFVATHTALDERGKTIGASGGVMGVAVIFACHFPRRSMYIIPIPIPIPAVVLVGFYILMDLIGAQNRQSEVAHWAHLGGAACGFLEYKPGWSFVRLWPKGLKLKVPGRGPKLRVHRETPDDEPADDYLTTGRLQKRVDELLEKISTSGEGSLTDEERKFLADASRRYQQQRRR